MMDDLHILGRPPDIGQNSFIGLTFLDLGDTMDELKIVKSFGSPSIIILSIHRTSNLLVSINGSLLWTYTLLLKIYILIPISISFLYFNNNFTILSIHISLFSLSSLSSLVPSQPVTMAFKICFYSQNSIFFCQVYLRDEPPLFHFFLKNQLHILFFLIRGIL